MSRHNKSFIEAGVSHVVQRQAMARNSYPLKWKHFDREAMERVHDYEKIGAMAITLQFAALCERLNDGK